jgi:Disulphide bond corrector protein DsbC
LSLSRRAWIAGAIALGFAGFSAGGQSPLIDSSSRPIAKSSTVQYLFPEQISVPAGKVTAVELHFRIAQGFHINSHAPKEDYLIPTTLSFPADSGVQLASATYPEGVEFTLPVDPDTKLNVYTGEFAIQARIVAQRGNHLVNASLRYQACDERACMPPKTITVPIDVIGQ